MFPRPKDADANAISSLHAITDVKPSQVFMQKTYTSTHPMFISNACAAELLAYAYPGRKEGIQEYSHAESKKDRGKRTYTSRKQKHLVAVAAGHGRCTEERADGAAGVVAPSLSVPQGVGVSLAPQRLAAGSLRKTWIV